MDINIIAVLVIAIGFWVLGAAWYSPVLFGKMWMEALGITEEEAKERAGAKAYIGSLVASLIMIFVLAHFVELAEASTFGHGLTTAFWCWFGFVAAISGMHAFFQGNPLKMYFIDIGYSLVGMLLAGGILAIW